MAQLNIMLNLLGVILSNFSTLLIKKCFSNFKSVTYNLNICDLIQQNDDRL